MGKTRRKTKALRLTTEDLELIGRLKQFYGVASDNEVIRMALRSAERERAALSSLPVERGGSPRPD
jgi:hypothetical protein